MRTNNDNVLRQRRAADTTSSQQVIQPNSSKTTLQVSPSGIDELPLILQSGIFFGIYTVLGVSTTISIQLIESLSKSVIGLEKWRYQFIDTSLPILLGLVYLLAGIGHFATQQDFCDIYPPKGTWGIWYLPGTATFHVIWTGIVELLGGAGLLFGGLSSILSNKAEGGGEEDDDWYIKLIQPLSAFALFVLTTLVTPANIYMYTHGATMGDMGDLSMSFHYIRFGIQVLFLSLLFVVAKDAFFYAWGDELD